MNRYKGKAARWQQQDKEEQRMNKTEFIKVRCTSEEKKRIKSRAESTGRKFSDYCREILLNGEVTAVPKMTDNEREAIVILQHTGRFYGQISNLIKLKDKDWLHITKNLSLCAKEAFKRFYDPHFRVDDEVYKVLNYCCPVKINRKLCISLSIGIAAVLLIQGLAFQFQTVSIIKCTYFDKKRPITTDNSNK